MVQTHSRLQEISFIFIYLANGFNLIRFDFIMRPRHSLIISAGLNVRNSCNKLSLKPREMPPLWLLFKVNRMKIFLRHKDLHVYGKIYESVHKTVSVN